jgi:hypothetical protein
MFQVKAVATKRIIFLVQNLKRVGGDFTPPVPETFAMVDGRMIVGDRCWLARRRRLAGTFASHSWRKCTSHSPKVALRRGRDGACGGRISDGRGQVLRSWCAARRRPIRVPD